jgi:signal transduction histidine kinase
VPKKTLLRSRGGVSDSKINSNLEKRRINPVDDPEFSRALLERLGNSATIVLAPDGTFAYLSQRAQDMFNVPKSAIGKSFSEVVVLTTAEGKEIFDRKHPVWLAVNTLPYTQMTPFFCQYQTGKIQTPIALNVLQIRQGKTVRAIVVQMREVQRVLNVGEMKSLFVSFAAHQLKTPSSVVKGFLELLLREGQAAFKPLQWDHINSAYEANENLIQLSKTLLNLTRLEGGLIEPKVSSFDPIALLRAKIRSHSWLFDSKKLTIKFFAKGKTKSFHSDETFVSEIFDIIFSNAIKFSPEKGIIAISSSVNAKELVVSILDEGPGISKTDQEKLFRDIADAKSDPNSHGLGLVMANKYISLLRGKIAVKSNGKKGTEFIVHIPNISV